MRPVKNINFDRDVREVLIEKLDQILDKVDDDILKIAVVESVS